MEEQSEQVEEAIDPASLFPSELQQTANDLFHLGYISKEINFCGNTFVIESIRPHIAYLIGQVLQPYRNTLAEPSAWAALHVAMALVSVNGDTSFCPPTSDNQRAWVEARLRWLTGPHGFWQPTIDYLYAKYVEMEQEVAKTIVETHRLSEEDRDTSQPSPDSSIDSGLTTEPTPTDSPPLVPFS